jgi:hypothetical protein
MGVSCGEGKEWMAGLVGVGYKDVGRQKGSCGWFLVN